MKKNKIKVNIIFIFLCLAYLTQLSSFAQNATSEAEVEFIPGMGPTYPVHPEDPNVDANDGAVEGSLAIVSVSRFEFGTIAVTSKTESFGIVTTMPNIQIVDLRGTGTGWNVSATVSRFTDGTDDTLPGAEIHVVNARPNSLSDSLAPVQYSATLTSDGEPVSVISAGVGAGTGLWVMRWYPPEGENKYIELEIPAGSATTGNHTATVNWILGNTP